MLWLDAPTSLFSQSQLVFAQACMIHVLSASSVINSEGH
jgi:hypothetical protein